MIVKDIDKGTITFIISDENVIDRHGERILVDGIDTNEFEKNPLMLYLHDKSKVIGKWENLRKEKGQLLANAIFDKSSDLGREVARQVEEGFLNATSLSVIPIEINDNKLLGQTGETISKSTLLEISIVTLPSNGNAVRKLSFDYTQRSISFLFHNKHLHKNNLDMKTTVEFKEILTLLGLTEEATDTQILAALKAVIEERNNLLKVNQETQKSLLKSIVQKGIDEKRILPIDINKYVGIGEKVGKETLSEIINKMPAYKPIYKMIQEAQQKEIQANELQDRSNWGLTEYRKYAPEELRNNPELFDKLLKEFRTV